MAAVALVDDDPGMRSFLDKAITPRVGQVVCVATADQPPMQLARHRFGLVILDIALPAKRGIAGLRERHAHADGGEGERTTALAGVESAIAALALQAALRRALDDHRIGPVGSEGQIPVDARVGWVDSGATSAPMPALRRRTPGPSR